MSKEITKKQIQIIFRTIMVPFESFGYTTLELFFQNQLEDIKNLYTSFELLEKSEQKFISLKNIDIKLILKLFIVSRDIIDPQEFMTITGYEWDESTEVIFRLIDILTISEIKES